MGRVQQHILDQILAATDIVDVVGAYVPLRERGANHVGLCPFHQEKTPSFSVHRERQIFKCFGCGKAGTAITFLQERENLSFREAIQILADRAGIQIPEDRDRRNSKSPDVDRHAVMTLAARQYVSWLEASPTALEYIEKRGLTRDQVRSFGLGYAPDSWSALTEFLKKTTPMEVAEELGLIAPRKADQGKGYYDRFRNRLMFPILNTISKVIAFGGRALGDDRAKYLNSPETSLFSKSRTLYLLDRARTTAKQEGSIIVVEGYMDTISLHVAGFGNAVATLGTAITAEHVRILRQCTEGVVLMYDGDSAGLEAARKGVGAFLAAGHPVDVVLLPEGEDPDSYTRTHGPEGMRGLLDSARDGFESLIQRSVDRYGISGAAAKQSICAELLPVLATIPAAVVQQEYLELLASQLRTSPDALRSDMRKNKASHPAFPPPGPPQSPDSERPVPPLTRSRLSSEEQIVMDMVCLVLYDSGILKGPEPLDKEEPTTGFMPPEVRSNWRSLILELVEKETAPCIVMNWALDSRPEKAISSHLQRLEEEHADLVPLACDVIERWQPLRERRKAVREIEAKIQQLTDKKELDALKLNARSAGQSESDGLDMEYIRALEAQIKRRNKT